MTTSPTPNDLRGAPRLLVEFALGSILTPALLIDGGAYVEAASPAALADLDLPPDAVRGQPVAAILGFDPDDQLGPVAPTVSAPAAALHHTQTDRGSIRWRALSLSGARLDGGWLIEFHRVTSDGGPGDSAGTGSDLGLRVERLDDLLVDLSERFENLNRYVGLISHDLQAPTRRLLSFVELLRGDVGGDEDEIDRSLDAIERGARHLLRLTSELLQYSRLGSRPMALEVVDGQAVLDATLEQLSQQITECHATVEVTAPVPLVVASPTFLGVVFQNLLQNGLKYRGDDDPHIVVSPSIDGDHVRIEVRDNGVGIAPELRAAVFQPFRRLGPGTDEHSGLGLTTVHDLVERFGGSISVTAGEVGAGSTFTLVLRHGHSEG